MGAALRAPATANAETRGNPNDQLVVAAIAVAAFALRLGFAHNYGYFRDELYYLACARHLAFGYVDHPPLSVLILYWQTKLLGDSLLAIRFLPAVAAGALAFLAARLAKDLGADLMGQVLAEIATTLAPVQLAQTGFYSMNAFEPIFWTLAALIVERIIREGNQRLWILFGVIAGLGLENKHSMLFFGFGLVAGLILTRERRQLASKWFWLGGAVAFLLGAPNLVWEVRSGWPTVEFMRNAQLYKDYHARPLEFVLGVVLDAQPISVVLTLSGLWFYLGSSQGRDLRVLGITYLAILGLLIVQGAKVYYIAPADPILFAAGGAALTTRLAGSKVHWLRPVYLVLLLVGDLLTAPLGLQILPPQQLLALASRVPNSRGVQNERHESATLPQHFADMFGWQEKAIAVASVYDSLAPDERGSAAILASNWGEAGAIDLFGPRLGLPHAYSPHNSYWMWGPPPDDTRIIITIGFSREDLANEFGSITEAMVVRCPFCVPYEDNLPIFICRNPKHRPSDIWPRAKHYI